MSSIVTSTRRLMSDHFEPEAALEPHEARRLRAHLEQIDYAAFAANREIMTKTLGGASLRKFERLAICAAQARARWVAAAMAMTESANPTPDQITELAALRTAFDELAEVYQGLRRMVERGYLAYQPKA